MRVKCLAQEHNTMSPARARTRTARSEVERTNHEATAPVWSCRASSNFLGGDGRIVWSNVFLLGHIPFLARQISITPYHYKSAPSPLHIMFKYGTKHLLYMSIDLNAGKVKRMVQPNRYDHIYSTINTMGVARIFQRGGHTDSYRGYSSDCHLNIVSCLLTRRLKKGGSRAPQDPPLATPMNTGV